MKKKTVLWLSIAAALLYWFIDSLLDAYIYHETSLFVQIFEPTPHEIYTRITTSGFFILSVVAILFIFRHKKAEKILQEKEHLLSESQRIAHIGSWGWDLTGLIKWSDETYRIYGVSPETFTPTVESLVNLVHPEDRPTMQEWLRACSAGEKPGDLEFHIILPDGSIRFINGRGNLVYDAENRPIRMVGTVQDITESRKAEEKLQQTNALLNALSRAQSQFIADTSPEVIFNTLLTDLISLTLSEYGFIGEVLYTDKEEPYLKTYAITNIAWDEETRKFYEKHAPGGMEFYNLKTLFGEVMAAGKPVISNNPSTDPRRGGLPNGHPALNAFLGLPFYKGQKLIGIVGIANRPGGYDEKIIDYLQPFLDTCANIIEAYRGEKLRRQAEETLNKILIQQEALLNNIPDIAWLKDRESRFIAVNEPFGRACSWNPKDLAGKTDLDIWPKELAEKYRADDREVMQLGKRKVVEEPLADKEGKIAWIETIKTPIYNEKGEVIGTTGIARDITERKKMEENIYRITHDWEETFNSITDMVTVHDNDWNIIRANKAAEKILKLPLLDISKETKCFRYYHGTGKPPSGCPSCDCLKTGVPATFELFEPHLNMHIELRAIPRFDSNNNIIGLIHVVRDMTEKKKLEEQLRHAQKMEAIGQLSGGVAHDFNNILTAIIGYGHMLIMKLKEEDRLRDYVEQILLAAERAANLTQSLLAFGRKQAMNPKPVDINTVVTGVEKLLLRVIGEDIEFKTVLSSVDLIVIADSGQIEQVLMNLATNARDAMPKGGLLTITTEPAEIDMDFLKIHAYGKPGRYALISVTDTGTGMDEKTREKIFEPFFTTKEVGKGTGLGLAMAYGIIKQHNGHINCYSEPGKGTTFKIYLPMVEAEKPRGIGLTEASEIKGGTETILVAEDEEQVSQLTKMVLENSGYKTIMAADGEDAVKKFIENKDKIHLVILDVIMPKMDGRAAYNRIKKLKPDVKVLFASGYPADFIHKKEILDEGLNFISKPVPPRDLLKKIREVLDK